MVIIGFSDKTSKLIPRIICRHFKHCVIITKRTKTMSLHQFVHRNHVVRIAISERGIAQLESHGWVFVFMHRTPQKFNRHAWTCVNYVKQSVGIKKFWIQTPDALYKYLKKNLT